MIVLLAMLFCSEKEKDSNVAKMGGIWDFNYFIIL